MYQKKQEQEGCMNEAKKIMNINFTCIPIYLIRLIQKPHCRGAISFLPLKLFFAELEPGTARLIKFMAQCGEFLP